MSRPRTLLRFLAATAALAVVLGALAIPASAQEPEANIHPDLAEVGVTSPAADAAQAAFDAVNARLAASRTAREQAEATITLLAARDAELTVDIADAVDARKAARDALASARDDIHAVAVTNYVRGTNVDHLTTTINPSASTERLVAGVLGDAVFEDRAAVMDAARQAVDRASRAIDAAQAERGEVRARIAETEAARAEAQRQEQEAATELVSRVSELARARATARVRGLDFSLVALDAYYRAAASEPRCGITWWAIAGISRVEGRHGTYGGARLLPNGDVTPGIIGIPLSGANNTAVIGDTDGGFYDGDGVWDRAVGPMQFIPSTWRRYARDGDGDGDTDPQNLYDSAAAAAAYLCAGGPMRSEADLRRGYFSYNHSEAYVEAVLANAIAYSQFRIR